MIKNTFEEQILMGRLPSSPGVGRLLVELVRRKELAPGEIAKAVAIDPALTGRVLQDARPLVPARKGPIETAQAAIEILGPSALLRALRNLTLVSSGGSKWCAGFEYDRYWSISLARAIAAETIVRSTGRARPESAYTLGLLADIGRLALATVYPTEYAALLSEGTTRDLEETCRLELERFRIHHAEVSACLLEHWGLPRSFHRAVLLYEREEEPEGTIDAQALESSEVLRCAQLFAEAHFGELTGLPSPAADRILPELGERMGLGEELARKVHADVRDALAARGRVPVSGAAVEGPAGRPTDTEDTDRRPVTVAAPGQGLRILAVDDDPTSLQILRRTLEAAGHKVQFASDGIEALQIALETNPQAIVADWMMPRMDGVELCKALRCIQIGREMYFLLLTGRDQEDQIVAAYDAGVDEYVTKPFNPRILLARLRAGQRVMELREQVDAERQVTAQQVKELGFLNRRLNTAALTDPLTGLPNRRHACDRLAEEWQHATRASTHLSVMMIDVDRFKKVNDEFGHEVGDLVLKEVAHILRTHARQGEDVARLGGEEFLVICPNTNAEQAAIGAERLRTAVESHIVATPAREIRSTVSLGVAAKNGTMQGIDALLKAADEAVYAAKSAGRNQVQVARGSLGTALSA